MNQYSKIYNPLTARFVKLNSKKGQSILNNYMKQLTFTNKLYGGAAVPALPLVPVTPAVPSSEITPIDDISLEQETMERYRNLPAFSPEMDMFTAMGALTYTLSYPQWETTQNLRKVSLWLGLLASIRKETIKEAVAGEVNIKVGSLVKANNLYYMVYKKQEAASPGKVEGRHFPDSECVAYLKFIFAPELLNITQILPIWVDYKSAIQFRQLAGLLQKIILAYISIAGGNSNNIRIIGYFCNWLQETLSLAAGTQIIIGNDAGMLGRNAHSQPYTEPIIDTYKTPSKRIFYNGRGICVNDNWTIGCGQPLMRFVDLKDPSEKDGNNPDCRINES